MPTYIVTLREVALYDVEVDAENEDDAADAAEERFVNEGCAQFPVTVPERETYEIHVKGEG